MLKNKATKKGKQKKQRKKTTGICDYKRKK